MTQEQLFKGYLCEARSCVKPGDIPFVMGFKTLWFCREHGAQQFRDYGWHDFIMVFSEVVHLNQNTKPRTYSRGALTYGSTE